MASRENQDADKRQRGLGVEGKTDMPLQGVRFVKEGELLGG